MHPQTTKSCSVDGCERPYYGKGYCSLHYRRWHVHGDPLVVKTGRPEDLVGQRFGRLVVLQIGPKLTGSYRWRCRCDCGNEITTVGHLLKSGRAKSCGCLRREITIARFTTHGHSAGGVSSPEHRIWLGIRKRCYNPNGPYWPYYGGRTPEPVTLCEHWREDFAQFLADMGPRPSPKHSVDKDHGPCQYWCRLCGGDVRWATPAEQRASRRSKANPS